MTRADLRARDELRAIKITTGYTVHAPGSVLIECGRTRVLCTAMIEEKVPPFLEGTGKGWLTAEYAMLPSSTPQRKKRENSKNGADGRSVEIARLIGRSLRCAVDTKKIGTRSILVDCDVLQADGGTRTAAITGGYIAVALAADALLKNGLIEQSFLKTQVAAISVGLVGGSAMLDLCYSEDSAADADVNLVMAGADYVEVQGTGERRAIMRDELNVLLDLGEAGIAQLMRLQNEAIALAITKQ